MKLITVAGNSLKFSGARPKGMPYFMVVRCPYCKKTIRTRYNKAAADLISQGSVILNECYKCKHEFQLAIRTPFSEILESVNQ